METANQKRGKGGLGKLVLPRHRERHQTPRHLRQETRSLSPGIIAHATWPLNTSLLEGFNNKIKVIKRMTYGFRDDEYFFLKIRAAFPGIPG